MNHFPVCFVHGFDHYGDVECLQHNVVGKSGPKSGLSSRVCIIRSFAVMFFSFHLSSVLLVESNC